MEAVNVELEGFLDHKQSEKQLVVSLLVLLFENLIFQDLKEYQLQILEPQLSLKIHVLHHIFELHQMYIGFYRPVKFVVTHLQKLNFDVQKKGPILKQPYS